MALGVRCYFLCSAGIGVLAMLSGCSGGFFFAQREAWRQEAEIECLNSGRVSEGTGIVRLEPIRGPGLCGADFPLKVSAFGESTPLSYTDDPRPPAAIPSAPLNWPASPQKATLPPHDARAPDKIGRHAPRQANTSEQPISLHPPGVAELVAPAPREYDYRHPYGRASQAPPIHSAGAHTASPPDDFSPAPYERRHLLRGEESAPEPSAAVRRAPLREPVMHEPTLDASRAPVTRHATAGEEPNSERLRRPEIPPLVPLRDSPGHSALSPVAVNPPATLACPIVSELDRWITGAVQPAAMHWFGSPVAEIKQISAYSCRGMNGNAFARISEHAFGNALDIAAFTLADGRTITVKSGWHGLPEEQGFLRDVQGAACDQFTTVLAPGSNAYHYDHIHVDLMRRSSDYRICNPHAVSGEEIAARAGGRLTARGTRGTAVTGSLASRRAQRASKRLDDDGDDLRQRALPLARPGEDGTE
jgi:hypothetical protein